MDPLTLVVITLATIVFGGYLLVNRAFSHWKKRGIYYIEPSFPYGNIKALATRKEFFGDTFKEFYKHFKSKGVKGGGVYTFLIPVFVAVDLDLVKNILQKDFGHFVNHGRPFDKKVDPLSGHLFNLENDEWRKMRVKLTPTFTSAKMKMMFQTFVACTEGLVDILNDHSIIQDPVDIKDVVSRFTTDIIGSCAFGIDCNSIKNPYSEFLTFETLRKHSAAGGIVRTCNKDYHVPGTDIILESGSRVHVPVHGIHNDPDYYPDPEKFDPERFSEENKASRPSFTFLAFGDGPRNCIGARFGLLQAKVGLLTIIRNFKVTLSTKTKIPIRYEPAAFITSVDGGVWLNVQSVQKNI